MLEEGLAAFVNLLKEKLGRRVTGVYTHPPHELKYPYILIDPREIHEQKERVYMKTDLYLFSDYAGIRESLQLANLLVKTLTRARINLDHGHLDCIVKARYSDLQTKNGGPPVHRTLLALRIFVFEHELEEA